MAEVKWTCAECDEEIAAGDGFVRARMSEVHAFDAAMRARPEKISYSVADFMELPDRAKWRAHHFRCTEDDEDYALAVEELRTAWDLVKWTSHLMGKAWLGSTDWADVLRSKVPTA